MRYPDKSFDHPLWIDRTIHGEVQDFSGPVDADVLLVRDVELGLRASERVDFLEDEADITYWADLAQCEAMNRTNNEEK